MTFPEWLRAFEVADPEPALGEQVRDKFEHYDRRMRDRGNGCHWRSDLVDAHMAWHTRMTQAYVQIKDTLL